MAKSKVKKPIIHIATLPKKELEDFPSSSLYKPKSPNTLLDFLPSGMEDDIKKEETLAIREEPYGTAMFMTDGNGRILSDTEMRVMLFNKQPMVDL